MSLGEHIDERGQGLRRFARIDMRQQPNGSLFVDDARRLGLPHHMLSDHVDEELFPFRRIFHLGADDGEQFVSGFARNFTAGEHLPLRQATSCAVTRRPRIIALMIVRLLSIAKAIITHLHSIRPGELWRWLR